MAAIPHFDLPLRYQGGSAAVNEQGSEQDIAACVFAVCATEPGAFLDIPEFGLPDLTFSQEPILPGQVVGPILQWEPRAALLAQVNPALYDEAIENINVEVGVSK